MNRLSLSLGFLGHVDYSSTEVKVYLFQDLCTSLKMALHILRTINTWLLGPPNVLCPVSCLVGTWVALSLASGTIFFTAVHVKHDVMIRLFHIGEVQLVTQNRL